ncbi:MAG TPA: hypothetical protein VGP72_24395 [Planctomycetota bacterium]|jgi:ribosomal protein L40E
MSYTFQCSRCQETLTADQPAGSRIVCPLCDQELTVPPETQVIPFEQDLAAALEHVRISDEDRSYARKLLELKLVAAEAVKSAVLTVKTTAFEGLPVDLADELIRSGQLDPKTDIVLRELLRIGSQPTVTERRVCPECLATIPENASECPSCAQTSDELALHDVCPKCLSQQPTGSPLCRSCGAKMTAGFKADPPPREIRAPVVKVPGPAAEPRRRVLAHSRLLALLVLAALSFAGYAHWPTIHHWVSVQLHGESATALRERVQQFDAALMFNDFAGLSQLIEPGPHGELDGSVQATIAGVSDPSRKLTRLLSIRHPEYVAGDGENFATVLTEARVELARENETSGSLLGDREELDTRVSWHWVLRDGKWYFSTPLPRTSMQR